MKLTRQAFIKAYCNAVAGAPIEPDRIIEAVAAECFGNTPPPKDDADVVDRLVCIVSDLDRFAAKLAEKVAPHLRG